MKTTLNIFSVLLASAVLFVGCTKEDTNVSGPTQYGQFSNVTYVSIGNSLTAGYQSGALFESGQKYSYPNLIAGQLGVAFEQPLMPSPGTGALITLESLTPPTLGFGPSNITPPSNLAHPAPYNNLGIPGAVLYDALDTANIGMKSVQRANPFFQLVLRNQQAFGASIVDQAIKLNPKLVTFWLGNNDVLGFATSGGYSPDKPTNTQFFMALYGATLLKLRTALPDAAILVATIPDVRSIPFFAVIGPQISAKLGVLGLSLYYQQHGEQTVGTGTTKLNLGSDLDPFIPLTAATYAPFIGQPTGYWYRSHGVAVPPGVDTTKPFGLHPQNPWPDALILDVGEKATVVKSTNEFNVAIKSEAERNNARVVDIAAFFDRIATEGYLAAGEKLTFAFISGGIFSFDGVHPTPKGQGLLANEFIRVMNAQYGSNIPYVEISSLPGVPAPLGKGTITKRGILVPPTTFDGIVRLFQ